MPNKEINIATLNKVLVVALLYDEANRRKAEIEMLKYLKGKGIVSFDYLDKLFNGTEEKMIAKTIASSGFDGVVILRLLDVKETNTIDTVKTFPVYYSNFGSYFYTSYPIFKSGSVYNTSKIYTVEITIFSIKEDKIIWSALTKTKNTDGISKFTNQLIKVVFRRMQQEGFIVH
jgi:hypothetical protein